MKIEAIKLRNFKLFRDIEIDNLPNYCVIVGANGAGKSTLFDAFGFLHDSLLFNVTTALQSRGGFNEVISREADEKEILIEIKFRIEIVKVERLVTYRILIGLESNKPVVKREILKYKRGEHGSPFHFLDFSSGKGIAITNEEDFTKTDEGLNREEQNLGSPDILAVKGLGQFQRFKAANAIRQMLEQWHISDFHIDQARGSKDAAGFSEHLSEGGENLQLVANNLFENHKDIFGKITETMKRRVPGVDTITPISSPDGRLILGFKDGSFKDPFIDRYVSDGTIKMFAYLVLLYDPKPHPLLCVEEPENQLYPKLLWELAEEFRDYSRRGGQVFVSTHSPDFLNACGIDEVFWLVKENGFSSIKRAADDDQLRAYVDEGDQLGYLWKQHYFPGADPG